MTDVDRANMELLARVLTDHLMGRIETPGLSPEAKAAVDGMVDKFNRYCAVMAEWSAREPFTIDDD